MLQHVLVMLHLTHTQIIIVIIIKIIVRQLHVNEKEQCTKESTWKLVLVELDVTHIDGRLYTM